MNRKVTFREIVILVSKFQIEEQSNKKKESNNLQMITQEKIYYDVNH